MGTQGAVSSIWLIQVLFPGKDEQDRSLNTVTLCGQTWLYQPLYVLIVWTRTWGMRMFKGSLATCYFLIPLCLPLSSLSHPSHHLLRNQAWWQTVSSSSHFNPSHSGILPQLRASWLYCIWTGKENFLIWTLPPPSLKGQGRFCQRTPGRSSWLETQSSPRKI